MLNMNNVQIDIGEGYLLSISQFTDGEVDFTYSDRANGTVEIAILDPNGKFVRLGTHDDVIGWVNFDGIKKVVKRFRKEMR